MQKRAQKASGSKVHPKPVARSAKTNLPERTRPLKNKAMTTPGYLLKIFNWKIALIVALVVAALMSNRPMQPLDNRAALDTQPSAIPPYVTQTPEVQAMHEAEILVSTAAESTSPTKTVVKIATPLPTAKVTSSPTSTPTSTPTLAPTIDYSKPWSVAAGCPQTTQRCVPCTSGTYCRFEPGNTHGFKGWSCQNNNPGNIRNASTNMATDFKNKIIVRNGGTAACGVRYDSRGGSYFVFATYDAGYGALKAYIKGINNGEHSSYAGTGWACGNCTITQFFSTYAPGDTSYPGAVASYIGEPVTQTLRFIVDNGKLDAFAAAIKTHEGFFIQ